MRNDHSFQFIRWASLAFAAGGLLMAVLWILYTSVHGPTSFDQTRALLGRSTLFWSLLLSIPPSLLVALGLIILYPGLARGGARMTRTGYTLTLISLIIPAVVDLFVWGGLGPPFFVPILGAGLILLAIGSRRNQRFQGLSLNILTFMGISLVIAFVLVFIPQAVSDQVGGYRIYGIFAHLLPGIGWTMLGASLLKKQALILIEPARD
jgi:hypothetical protein